MNNQDYIDAYGGESQIIADRYKVKNRNGELVDLDGVVCPLKIDNRQLFAPIDSQRETPHCAGYSAASIVESLYWQHTGRLLQLDSHQVYAAAKATDGALSQDGTYLEHAMDAVLRLCRNRPDFQFMKDAKVGLIYGGCGQATIDAVKRLVHKHLIIQAGFAIDEGWYDVNASNYKIRQRGRQLGGHAVNVCGYDSDGFYVANQWSTGFGAKGFAVMEYPVFTAEFMYGAYLYDIKC